MMFKKKKNLTKIKFHPALVFLVLTIVVMIISSVGGILNIESNYYTVNTVSGELESQVITINNLFNRTGLQYLISNFLPNFINFAPLGTFILGLMGVGVAYKSGFLNTLNKVIARFVPRRTYQHIGVLNDVLMRLGIISKNIAWLGSPKYAFWSVVMAEAWRGLPFFTIILSASLQTIPQDVYESAQVDGANSFQRFTKITLPLMKRTIIFSCLLRSVWEFNNIDVIYALTSGGPANKTTTSAMYLIRTAIEGNNFGYGSAIAVASLLFLVLCSLVVMLLTGLTKREVN